MELQYCREFVKLVEIGNYLKAADELFMSQSTLSRHIQQLEKDLGHSLFNRNTRTIELTPFGTMYLDFAKQAVELEDQFTDRLKIYNSEGHVTIYLANLGTLFHIPEILQEIHQIRPDLTVHTQLVNPDVARKALRSHLCDFIITRVPDGKPLPADCECHFLCHDNLAAVMASDNPLAGKESLTLKDVATQPIALSEPDNPVYIRLASAFTQQAIQIRVAFWSNATSLVLDLVGLDKCITVYAQSFAETIQLPSIVWRPITDIQNVDLYLETLKNDPLSPNARYVAETIIDWNEDHRSVLT